MFDVELLRTKTFDRRIEHAMEEIRNELNEMRNEMRQELMNLRHDMAHNRQNIQNVNTRQGHINNNIPVNRPGNSENLDHLCQGCFEIIPLSHRMSKVFIAHGCCSWLRWSNQENKFTTFTFREITEDGKRYFHIFSADFPDWHVTMGVFSLYARCKEGSPTACIDGTWDIQRIEHYNNDCYVLCTKDGNYLSTDKTGSNKGGMEGKRSEVNENAMFFIRKKN